MEISLNNSDERKVVQKIKIYVANKEFTIYVGMDGLADYLIINKEQYGDGERSIVIRPLASNDISIT